MAHQVYENVVLSNKITDILTTNVAINNYLTVDTSLTEEAGMKKKIITYNSTGNIEQLAMGKGNTEGIEVTNSTDEYEVLTYQGKFEFYDEEEMTDPMIVETGLKHAAAKMTNKFVAEALEKMGDATLSVSNTAWSFDVVVDAIAKMGKEVENGLFLLVSPADLAAIRKALKNDLTYSEAFVRTGYIGSVCGVPVIISEAVPAGQAFLGTNEAVTLFMKKDTETEYVRDADHRKNTYFVRKVAVVALTDGSKIVKITIGA
jgi:hypothetical protein